jgi:hypothetical protein
MEKNGKGFEGDNIKGKVGKNYTLFGGLFL